MQHYLFTDGKNSDDIRSDCFDEDAALVVHSMRTRGIHPCYLCGNRGVEITMPPEGLKLYTGSRTALLGMSEMIIPNPDGGFYTSPSLLYHYIVEHDYLPPPAFLKALEAFYLNVPYNVEKAQNNLKTRRIKMSKLQEMDLVQAKLNGSVSQG